MVSRWKDFVTTKVCPTPWVNEWTFTPLLGVPSQRLGKLTATSILYRACTRFT